MKKLILAAVFCVLVFPSAQAADPVAPAVEEEALSSPKPLPKGVKALLDVPYVANATERQTLDLYLPATPDRKLRPVIIRIHGGAWRKGDKKDQQSLSNYVAKGFVAVALNYRLSQDAPFPAQIEDCKAAVRWLRAHAAEYGIDPNRIIVWGASAGGHLVALLGTTGNTRKFDVGENLQFASSVQAVLDFYGPTDLTKAETTPGYEKRGGKNSAIAQLLGGPLADNMEKAASANPIAYISKDCPPFIIFHGDSDPIVPPGQSELLYQALQKAGVPSAFYLVKGGVHGGEAFKTEEYKRLAEEFVRCYAALSSGDSSPSGTLKK